RDHRARCEIRRAALCAPRPRCPLWPTGGIIRAMHTLALAAAVALAAQAAPSPKADIVSVTGCLREATPNTWTLVNATDPVPSNATAPLPKDIPATPPVGKNEYRLIGVFEFNMPSHKDHTV